MAATGIRVSILIRAELDRVWELTQNPALHARWDLRFSRITPTGVGADGRWTFDYERRVPLHTIRGTGVSLGDRDGAGGSRTSALRFATEDRLSPVGEGRGYWRYELVDEGVRFSTGYDYRPGWGRAIDRLLVRRVIGWMTAWSFDRVRIWAETGQEPERWPVMSALSLHRPGRPRAARCTWSASSRHPLADAPADLARLGRS